MSWNKIVLNGIKLDSKKNQYVIPLIITIIFICSITYVSVEHYQFVSNGDGLYYLNAGKQILEGGGDNVHIPNAPIGGPVIYGLVDKIVNDGFLTLKIISILSSAGIVFCSYYIIRNVFGVKIAILGQIFFAISPALHSRAIFATNELLPILFIILSFYFLTKKDLKRNDLIMSAMFIGIASDIRFQAMIIFIVGIIFLVINFKKLKKSIKNIILFSFVFLIFLMPVIGYNFVTHGTIMDSNLSMYLIGSNTSQTEEGFKEIINIEKFKDITENILFKNNFFESYSYNLFFHNPNLIFNFVGQNAISIIPIIPYVGMIIPVIGFLGLANIGNERKIILTSIILSTIVMFIIILFADLKIYFLPIIFIPITLIGLYKIKSFPKNLIPIIILPTCYLTLISFVSLGRADHLFYVWISIATFSSIFFVTVLPKIFLKITHRKKIINGSIIFLIILVIFSNIGFSYKLMDISLYGETVKDLKTEFENIFQLDKEKIQRGYPMKEIADILAKQPNIENSYVMSSSHAYNYYTNSKNIWVFFEEGVKGDSIENYILKTNWNSYDIFYSNTGSIPQDRYGKINHLPDYIVYESLEKRLIAPNPNRMNFTQTLDLKVLENPEDLNIPENFQLIFKSSKTGAVIYKINWENETDQ